MNSRNHPAFLRWTHGRCAASFAAAGARVTPLGGGQRRAAVEAARWTLDGMHLVSDAALAAFDLDGAVREHRNGQRRRELVAQVEDHIGALHDWPRKEQRLVLTRAGGRGDIFRFILFLLGNRVPPRPVATLLLGLGLLPTSKKRRDAWDAMRAFRDGTLRPDAFYWNMECNSRSLVHDLQSWCAHGVPVSMRDSLFWADAQRMLLA